MFRITTAVNSINPVSTTVSPVAITHLARRVCQRLIGTGWR